jgi:tetratricopeptide (TPR) repeat protein
LTVSSIFSSRSAPLTNEPVPLSEQVLAHAQSGRDLVQDFVALADSLEWELGQEYLRQRGNKAFLSDASPVPFVINNDGTLSRNAAEILFVSLQESEKAVPLDEEIFVLELGIGVGLFARFFLDRFRELCRQTGKDYYDRLSYIAADRSDRMLLDLLRHGVLAEHVGRYRVRQIDAMAPERALASDAMFRGKSIKLHAVFLNYLLDCLPAAVLHLEGDAVQQLCVRTCVARNVRLADHTDLTLPMLQERARSSDPEAKRELLEVYGLFASEYDYRSVDPKTLPKGEFALEYGRPLTHRLLHSYGAIQSLEKLLDLVDDRGFILVNDYGPTQTSREDEFEHQRFSLATFVGVNFPQLRAYFHDGGRCQVVEPTGDQRGIHSRLLARRAGSDTVTRFYEKFSDAHHAWLQDPVTKARACVQAGRFELAASNYREGLQRQPGNWVLLNEISTFLTFQLRDLSAGIDMAKLALAQNPTCSADLWSTLGDGLYEFGRTAEARSAYLKALSVNASDVRSRYNLAWVHNRENDYPKALAMIAEAMSFDKTGAFRDRLLQKQNEIVARLNIRNQREYLLLINLVSKYAKSEDAAVKPPPVPDHRD